MSKQELNLDGFGAQQDPSSGPKTDEVVSSINSLPDELLLQAVNWLKPMVYSKNDYKSMTSLSHSSRRFHQVAASLAVKKDSPWATIKAKQDIDSFCTAMSTAFGSEAIHGLVSIVFKGSIIKK